MTVPTLAKATLSLAAVWLWSLGGLVGSATTAIRGTALIQERGVPLQAGTLTGASRIPLERAEGGDTPVLTFDSQRGPVRLLLDTGAGTSMVTPALLERLALPSRPLPPQAFALAGGGADCESLKLASAELPELRLPPLADGPPLRLSGLQVLVLPVAALPQGVDGVLGAPSLRQLPFVVDPRQRQVLFGSPALRWRQSMASLPEMVSLRWLRGVPLASLRLQLQLHRQERRVEALADTGAEGLFLTRALAATLAAAGPEQPLQLVGVCGRQEVGRQRVVGISLASQGGPPQGSPPSSSQGVEVILTSNPVFALLGVEAIVGQELLRSRRQLWRLDVSPPRLELW